MATPKAKLASIWEEFQRTVGMIENKVASKTVDAFITFDELDVSAELRAKLKKLDLNGDGKLTLEELQLALKNGLDAETAKVVKEARDTVNAEIMQLYSEAMEAFTKAQTRLESLKGTGVDGEKFTELQDRAAKIHDNLTKMIAALKKKPAVMGLLKEQIRDFIRDVRTLEKAR